MEVLGEGLEGGKGGRIHFKIYNTKDFYLHFLCRSDGGVIYAVSEH